MIFEYQNTPGNPNYDYQDTQDYDKGDECAVLSQRRFQKRPQTIRPSRTGEYFLESEPSGQYLAKSEETLSKQAREEDEQNA